MTITHDDPTAGLVPDANVTDPNEEFYVLSLKYSRGPRELLVWWAPDCNGYSIFLEGAGIYTRARVQQRKLSDGESTLAIPVAIVRELSRSVVHERDMHQVLEVGKSIWGLKVVPPREQALLHALMDIAESAKRLVTEGDDEECLILTTSIENIAVAALEEARSHGP